MTIKKLFNYRTIWMGFAMLWIMSFHCHMNIGFRAIAYIREIGYGGVDIFLFASGIGNYFSYNRDNSPLDFIKRRIFRLAPSYIPFICVWCIIMIIRNRLSPLYIPGNLLGIQNFSVSGTSFNWYLTGLIICYLLTPYFATFVKRNRFRNNCIFIIVLVIISFAFLNDHKFIISYSRLPIYFIGMLFAKHSDTKITKKHILLGLLMFVIGCFCLVAGFYFASDKLWNFGLYWYPFILITPFLCYLISLVSMLFEKNRVLKTILSIFSSIGNCSFELYLVHVFIFEMVDDFIAEGRVSHPILIWLLAVVFAFICAYSLKWVSKKISKLIVNKK